jgi:hypothetical protein
MLLGKPIRRLPNQSPSSLIAPRLAILADRVQHQTDPSRATPTDERDTDSSA